MDKQIAAWIIEQRPDGIPAMTPAQFIPAEELFGGAEQMRVQDESALVAWRDYFDQVRGGLRIRLRSQSDRMQQSRRRMA